MAEDIRYIQVASGGFARGGSLRWLFFGIVAALAVLGGFVGWRWLDDHVFSIGVEDAGTTTVNEAELIERVRTFQLVTTQDTYDTRSDTEFHKRLNLGIKTFDLPGFVAGQELDVKADVTVSAGVDLAQIAPGDIQVIQQSRDGAVVVIRIPEAEILSTEIDASTFDISTGQGILTRISSTVGLGERDIRDGAVGAVTSIAEEEAVRSGLLRVASLAAQEQLQSFLQSLPQAEGSKVTYLVEIQVLPPQ